MKLLLFPIMLMACSSYPDGYSEAEKACYDYGVQHCDLFLEFCSWEPDFEQESFFSIDTSRPSSAGYTKADSSKFLDEYVTCVDNDIHDDAYKSGVVAQGCDLPIWLSAVAALGTPERWLKEVINDVYTPKHVPCDAE